MSDGNLNRVHDREVVEQRKSMFYVLGLATVILVVIGSIAIAIR